MTPKQNGYGVIKFKSPITGQHQTVNVHRLSFIVFNDTMDIKCHNRLCMLKHHLSAEPMQGTCLGLHVATEIRIRGMGNIQYASYI